MVDIVERALCVVEKEEKAIVLLNLIKESVVLRNSVKSKLLPYTLRVLYRLLICVLIFEVNPIVVLPNWP